MGDGEVLLSTREADRVAVIREVVERRLPQSEAARRLGVGVRQVKRLVRRYREFGAAGLASARRGRRSNRAFDEAFRGAVLELVRKRYRDFGPSFACEKLAAEHGHRLSAETLRGICGIEAGNAYLPEFMADYNRRFGVAPRNPADAHRAVLHDARELDLILCEQHARKITRNLSISFEGRTYQVTGRGKGHRVRGAAVTVCKGFDGSVTVLRGGRELPVRLLGEGEDPSPVEDGKSVRSRVDRAKAEQRSRPDWKPAPDHPWRRPFKPEADGVAAG